MAFAAKSLLTLFLQCLLCIVNSPVCHQTVGIYPNCKIVCLSYKQGVFYFFGTAQHNTTDTQKNLHIKSRSFSKHLI